MDDTYLDTLLHKCNLYHRVSCIVPHLFFHYIYHTRQKEKNNRTEHHQGPLHTTQTPQQKSSRRHCHRYRGNFLQHRSRIQRDLLGVPRYFLINHAHLSERTRTPIYRCDGKRHDLRQPQRRQLRRKHLFPLSVYRYSYRNHQCVSHRICCHPDTVPPSQKNTITHCLPTIASNIGIEYYSSLHY